MPGFDALYKQTITLFNRKKENGVDFWYPFILDGVHLIMDKAIIISTYGEQSQDNARVHIQYNPTSAGPQVKNKTYMLPKVYAESGNPLVNFTLGYGDNFDFIMEGAFAEETLSAVTSKASLSVSVDEAAWKKSELGVTGIYVFTYDGSEWLYGGVAADLEAYGISVSGDPVENDKITVKYVSAEGPINDNDYRNGFYNYMNRNYDNIFAISNVSKFNLIPHFEIGAK